MKSVSIVIPNLNDDCNLEKLLLSIKKQGYKKELIEIIVVDGGSTDRSLEIAQKFKAKVIIDRKSKAEAAKGIGISKAKNELILLVDSDNILEGNNWLEKMARILEKEKEAVAVYPFRYQVRKSDKVLNRYFGLFGVNDPVAYFMGKADRQSYLENNYALLGKVIKDEKDYFLVEFDRAKVPTLGANGFLIKKDILAMSKYKKRGFYHIDSNWDLIDKGYNKYMVAKTEIIHASGESLGKYIYKRAKYFDQFYAKDYRNRQFYLFDFKKDWYKLVWFGVASQTIIFPLYQSIRGYIRKPDIAWFLHPLICFMMFWIYGYAVLKAKLNLGSRLG